MTSNVMSTGQLAQHFGCKPWQVCRLFERGLLPPATRCGLYRYITPTDLPAVETALHQAGYIRSGRTEVVRQPSEVGQGVVTLTAHDNAD